MTNILENLFGKALSIRKKTNRTKLPARASRVARGVPEVMVKISGFGKSASHIRSHLDYISRKGEVPLETDTGEQLKGREDIEPYFDTWREKEKNAQKRVNSRETLHLILSMPAHVDAESVRKASRSFAGEVFEKHEYTIALHTDSNNPHCHLVVRTENRDGRKINPRKADLQHWRETFAEKIREQGYEAEATSRRTRGTTRKREKSPLWHMAAEKKTRKPRTAKVKASRIREAVMDITGDAPRSPRPWEPAIDRRQKAIRRSWLDAADELEKQAFPENASLPWQIREMIVAMPPVETERARLKRELMERFVPKPEKTPTRAPEKSPTADSTPKKQEQNWER